MTNRAVVLAGLVAVQAGALAHAGVINYTSQDRSVFARAENLDSFGDSETNGDSFGGTGDWAGNATAFWGGPDTYAQAASGQDVTLGASAITARSFSADADAFVTPPDTDIHLAHAYTALVTTFTLDADTAFVFGGTTTVDFQQGGGIVEWYFSLMLERDGGGPGIYLDQNTTDTPDGGAFWSHGTLWAGDWTLTVEMDASAGAAFDELSKARVESAFALVIPTPGSAGILALGAVAGAGRRRREPG